MELDTARSPLLIGVDAGTSRLRALVFTPSGEIAAQGTSPTPIVAVEGGGEFDPEALWQAVLAALREAVAKIDDPKRIRGLAVASVAESGIAFDNELRPVAPSLAWYDQRPGAIAHDLARRLDADAVHMTTGMPLNAIASLCKMLWLGKKNPEALASTRHWLNVADYIAFRLTGIMATEGSLAGRMACLDLDRFDWHRPLLAELGLDAGMLPPVGENGARLGNVTADIARQTGLPEDCVVGLGGHDHVVGSLASGIFGDHSLMDSMGTAEGLVLPLPGRISDQRFVDWTLEQTLMRYDGANHYFFCGGLYTSSAAIEWFRNAFAQGFGYDEMMEAAGKVPEGAHGVLFVPHLRLATSPDNYAGPGGAFFRLSTEADRPVLYRALLEGLAFDARNIADHMAALLDPAALDVVRARPVTVIGGGSQNALWLDIKASVFGRPIRALRTKEAVSLGAALLAGVAAGLFGSVAEAIASISLEHDLYTPDPARQALYDDLFAHDYQQALAATRLARR